MAPNKLGKTRATQILRCFSFYQDLTNSERSVPHVHQKFLKGTHLCTLFPLLPIAMFI